MALPLRLLPWTVALIFIGAFFGLGLAGWPGEFVEAGGMFCEEFRSSWVKQPANTWSNLGFVAAGLWMAWRVSGAGAWRVSGAGAWPGAGRNLFMRSRTMPLIYATLVVFLGPGSMFMHGSGRAWGGTADVVSMLLWIAFPVAYGAVRCLGTGERSFWALYLAIALGLGVPRTLGVLPFSVTLAYVVLIPTFALFEGIAARRTGATQERRYLLGAGASFAVALAIWRLSHTGAPLCEPASLLQGHAVWHLLCAVSTLGIFLFYATEDEAIRVARSGANYVRTTGTGSGGGTTAA